MGTNNIFAFQYKLRVRTNGSDSVGGNGRSSLASSCQVSKTFFPVTGH